MVTIKQQTDNVTTVTKTTGDWNWWSVFSDGVSPDTPLKSELYILFKVSSTFSDNCFSAPIAIRRFPAGDEFIQSPVFFWLKIILYKSAIYINMWYRNCIKKVK